MHKFVLNLITEWRRLGLPVAEETLVVAVSGGADSLALLLAIEELRVRKKIDLRLVAAHFNHKLRGRESDADEEFVRQIAAERGFELAIGSGPIRKDENLEQNARNARYAFLAETAENLKARKVLTAHTINDQAETFLLNLIRGSGPDGLGGMRPTRGLPRTRATEHPVEEPPPQLPFAESIILVRPLLTWAKREDTENFCHEMGVEFRYDTMNEDMSFKRVRVRKMLLPMLKEFNPKIIETLARTAELMQTEGPRAEGLSADPVFAGVELSVSDIKGLETADLRNGLREWLRARRGSLRSVNREHIEAIIRLVKSTKSGRTAELPGFGRVVKQNGGIRFENIRVD